MTTELERCLYCENCRKPMGLISQEELYEYWDFKDNPGLCFDCDPESASTVPSLFWQWKPGDLFTLGDEVFCVTDTEPQQLVNVGFSSHAWERMCAESLSSSTYLNTFINQGGARGKIQDTHWPCSECPEGWLWPKSAGWKCDRCNYFGPKVRAMILPDWILNPELGFTRKPNSADCPSCAKVKALHDGQGLCDYHQSLYDLTFNGDILEVGHE